MIRVKNVSKYYGGKRALGPVSFEIADAETVGFLGLNGAGKTTVLRMLACDLSPSSGSIEVDGIDTVANPHEVKKRIGFVPESPPLYGDMTVVDYLRFAGELRAMSPGTLRGRLGEVLALTQLTSVAGQVISTLSHGYKQRVGVAQAIIHQPKLLILDEPTRGLDPVQIVEMRKLVNDLKTAHTVLVSSHILTEISQTCDRLLVLGKGDIIGSGTEQELSAHGDIRQVSLTLRHATATVDDLRAALLAIAGVDRIVDAFSQAGGVTVEVATSRDVRAELGRAVIAAGWDLLRLDYARSELEGTFLRLVGDKHVSN